MVAKKRYIPERGDIVWLDFNPTRGHEQGGRRPALVISSRAYNTKSGLALFCPITSRAKGYPFEVALQTKSVEGVALVDQVRSMDWAGRKAEKITVVSATVLAEVQDFLQKLIKE